MRGCKGGNFIIMAGAAKLAFFFNEVIFIRRGMCAMAVKASVIKGFVTGGAHKRTFIVA